MRERIRLNWSLAPQTPVGVTARWLQSQGLKDHVLEAALAFWYPFALQSQFEVPPTATSVPTLSAKAEALLAISRLERQIALLRQTFLDELALPEVPPVPATALTMAVPAPVTTHLPSATAPLAVVSTAVTDVDVLPLLPPVQPGLPTISGFESFDQSLSGEA